MTDRSMYGSESMLVYRKIGTHKDTCNLGHKHTVEDYVTKRITKKPDTFYVHDTGYYKVKLPVYVDYQGRLYLTHEAFDTGRWYWLRENDNSYWTREVPRGW